MLSEFAEPFQHAETAAAVAQIEGLVPQSEAEAFEEPKEPLGDGRRRELERGRIGGVDRHADCDRLPMAQPIRGEGLELVGGPMAEVERARASELERVTRGRDVLQMELRASAHEL